MEVITSKFFFVLAKLSVVIDLFSEGQQLSKKFESLLAGIEVLPSGPRNIKNQVQEQNNLALLNYMH